MKRLAFFSFLLVGFYFTSQGQSMEEKVTNYLESFLTEHKSAVSKTDLAGTTWTAADPMGNRILTFTENGKFRMESDGFQASTNKHKGSWYINKEFVVLEIKREKTPVYVLKNQGELVLVEDDQIDVLKQLLTDASYKDGELKPYSYSEVFTFLNGYAIQQ